MQPATIQSAEFYGGDMIGKTLEDIVSAIKPEKWEDQSPVRLDLEDYYYFEKYAPSDVQEVFQPLVDKYIKNGSVPEVQGRREKQELDALNWATMWYYWCREAKDERGDYSR